MKKDLAEFINALPIDYSAYVDQYLIWLEDISNKYQRALNTIDLKIKDVQKEIRKAIKIKKGEINDNKTIKIFIGYDWYIDQREIFRFFIDSQDTPFTNIDESLARLKKI